MIELRGRRILVTGGTGFIGSALVRALAKRGARVRSLDNNFRGTDARLRDVASDIEIVTGDVRDAAAVRQAARGMESICHLASVNGTGLFYEQPDLVLEVAVKGMMHVLDACMSEGVLDLMVASSSEVYQDPPHIPTPEDVPLVVPDVANPRFSYGGGKIISELLAINYGRRRLQRAIIVRPHNVYGPDMGTDHVVPQFALRMADADQRAAGPAPFPIQGTGEETRAFIYIDDCVDGLLRVLERGAHLNVYNIGTTEEVAIADLARLIARCFGRTIDIIPGPSPPGSCRRRSPDVTKLAQLGFTPHTTLEAGVKATVAWYRSCCPV